jgi:hypothetical protein
MVPDRCRWRVALLVDHYPSMQPPMDLQPLTDDEYADFAERQVAESARQRILADEWTPEVAPALARAEAADLLADRLRGAGHRFLKGVAPDGTLVGWLWVGPTPAFLGPGRERPRSDSSTVI